MHDDGERPAPLGNAGPFQRGRDVLTGRGVGVRDAPVVLEGGRGEAQVGDVQLLGHGDVLPVFAGAQPTAGPPEPAAA